MEIEERIAYIFDSFHQLQAEGIVKTQGDFARLLGVSQNSLSAAKKGDERYLTDSMIGKVKAIMNKEVSFCCEYSIPVIPTEALAGSLVEFAGTITEYECEKMLSPIKGADLAIKVYGDSMAPEYTSGSIAIIKKVNEQAFIEWGKVYVLDTENGAVIKQVRKTDNPAVIECVSLNPAYQPFTINLKHINGWYRVLMVMSAK